MHQFFEFFQSPPFDLYGQFINYGQYILFTVGIAWRVIKHDINMWQTWNHKPTHNLAYNISGSVCIFHTVCNFDQSLWSNGSTLYTFLYMISAK